MTTSVGSNENIRLSRHIEKLTNRSSRCRVAARLSFLVRTRKRARYDLRELSGGEKSVLAHPDCPFPSCVLGVIDGALGREKEALRADRGRFSFFQWKKDTLDGKFLIKNLAIIAAWVGEKDLACEQFGKAIWYPMYPGPSGYGELKLLPIWDPLRGDPRFERIAASLAPK
jgi:hypothetical protein